MNAQSALAVCQTLGIPARISQGGVQHQTATDTNRNWHGISKHWLADASEDDLRDVLITRTKG